MNGQDDKSASGIRELKYKSFEDPSVEYRGIWPFTLDWLCGRNWVKTLLSFQLPEGSKSDCGADEGRLWKSVQWANKICEYPCRRAKNDIFCLFVKYPRRSTKIDTFGLLVKHPCRSTKNDAFGLFVKHPCQSTKNYTSRQISTQKY